MSCARTACSCADDVEWFNLSTKQLYCRRCAERINAQNAADALRLYGQPRLCIPVVELVADLEAKADRGRLAADALLAIVKPLAFMSIINPYNATHETLNDFITMARGALDSFHVKQHLLQGGKP